MDSRPPSTSASVASTLSSALSLALDFAACRSCTKCSRRMSSYAHDKHSLCLHCRDFICSVDIRCRECSSWSTDEMLEYLKYRKSLVSKGKKRSSVATPTSASPSVSPSVTPVKVCVSSSKVASPVSSLPSLASEEGLKTFVHSVLASFLSQPSSSLGSNPFLPAPSAEVPDVSCSGSAGGSEGDNLMRGRPVAPSGVVPLPIQEDVIPPPPPPHPSVCVHVPVASDTVGSGVGVFVMGPSTPLLGQFSDFNRQDFDQSQVRVAPGYDLLHDVYSHDLCNVAPSPSSSFNPTSLLFPLSDSGFVSHPPSVPFSSSPAFSLPLSSSAASFSSLASAPLSLFTLPSVVPSVISLSSSSSSSAPSFPLPQFSSPVFPSAAPPPSSAPLPLFPAPSLFSTPVRPPPGFSAPPSVPQALLPSYSFPSAPLPSAVSSASSLFSGGAPPGYPPVSFLASSSAASSSSSSSSTPVGDLADFQARMLGLSAEYQALGRWFVASRGSDFRSYLASYCPLLYSDLRADFASGSSRFLVALSSSASSFFFFCAVLCLFSPLFFSASGGSGPCLFFAASFSSSLPLPCSFAGLSPFFHSSSSSSGLSPSS